MDRTELLERAGLNEDELFREMVRRSEGTVLEEDGLLLLAGPSRHLRIAMRTAPRLPAVEVLRRAEAFFGERGEGWTLCVREPADAELVGPAVAAGLELGWEEFGMAINAPPAAGRLPAEAELRRVATPAEVADLAAVVAEANDDAEAERAGIIFARPESVLAPHISAFVAYLDGAPASSALTLVSHGVAGIFWVATIERARRRGLGDALTRAATRAGFAMGARAAWLGASRMGMSLYRQMGFEDVDLAYREYESP